MLKTKGFHGNDCAISQGIKININICSSTPFLTVHVPNTVAHEGMLTSLDHNMKVEIGLGEHNLVASK